MHSRLWGFSLNPIRKQAERALGYGVSEEDAAKWACSTLQRRVSGGSWRTYKSRHLAEIQDDDVCSRVRKIYATDGRLQPGERRPRRKSKREKSLTNDREETLFKELRKPGYTQWAYVARMWLRATKLTGLRPVEWRSASVVSIDGHPCLRCKNAKVVKWDFFTESSAAARDQGRVTAIYRNIPIGHLRQEDQSLIAAMAAWAGKVNSLGEFDSSYSAVRGVVYRAAKMLWPGDDTIISLYSARHAFRDGLSVQLSAGGYTPAQAKILTAVLMGHGSTETQYAYGIGSEETVSTSSVMAIQHLTKAGDVVLRRAVSQVE